MRALGYHQERENSKANYWSDVRNHLTLRQVKLLHFDEAQEVFEASSQSDIRGILDMFKGLMGNEEWPTIVALSGMPILELLMEENFQALRRFYRAPLEPISMIGGAAAVGQQLKSYADMAGLLPRFNDDLVLRLIHAASDQLGLAMEIIVDAIQEALMAGDSELTGRHFADAYERHTDCDIDLNIFESDEWRELRTLRVADVSRPEPKPVRRKSTARRDSIW